MSFRVKPDGTIECDAASEALKLQDAILQKRPKQRPKAGTSQSKDKERGSAIKLFSGSKRSAVEALLKETTAIPSDALAKQIEVEPKGLPPVIRSLHNWAKAYGLNLSDLIEQRAKSVNGKTVTTYRLTDIGRDRFQKELYGTNGNGSAPHENA